jgi:hypothetical protein
VRMPANVPHALEATARTKMLLAMLRSPARSVADALLRVARARVNAVESARCPHRENSGTHLRRRVRHETAWPRPLMSTGRGRAAIESTHLRGVPRQFRDTEAPLLPTMTTPSGCAWLAKAHQGRGRLYAAVLC